MSNSIYRLVMRWIYKTLYPLIAPLLHTCQFGGRQGSSTAHATQVFLNDLDSLTDIEAILAFDVYHAFDSPPKYLIRQTLDKMGTPTNLLQIISLVLEHGATYIRSAADEIFSTTHGVKQGCPLSFFLFVVVFDIPLRFLSQHGIHFSAYVDDISSPAPKNGNQRLAALVQHALSLIACQVNANKSESLQVSTTVPTLLALPKYYHPPSPVHAQSQSTTAYEMSAGPPEWSSLVNCPFSRTSCLMHLGHPIPARWDASIAVKVITDELRSQLNELHTQPI